MMTEEVLAQERERGAAEAETLIRLYHQIRVLAVDERITELSPRLRTLCGDQIEKIFVLPAARPGDDTEGGDIP